jgi:hypothetical protein
MPRTWPASRLLHVVHRRLQILGVALALTEDWPAPLRNPGLPGILRLNREAIGQGLPNDSHRQWRRRVADRAISRSRFDSDSSAPTVRQIGIGLPRSYGQSGLRVARDLLWRFGLRALLIDRTQRSIERQARPFLRRCLEHPFPRCLCRITPCAKNSLTASPHYAGRRPAEASTCARRPRPSTTPPRLGRGGAPRGSSPLRHPPRASLLRHRPHRHALPDPHGESQSRWQAERTRPRGLRPPLSCVRPREQPARDRLALLRGSRSHRGSIAAEAARADDPTGSARNRRPRPIRNRVGTNSWTSRSWPREPNLGRPGLGSLRSHK